MAIYELQLNSIEESKHRKVRAAMPAALDEEVFRENVGWFVRLRWGVIFVFLLVTAVSRTFPSALDRLGVTPPAAWPLAVVAILFGANLVFRLLGAGSGPGWRVAPATNIWAQIILDLICLTVVVHFVGSTGFAAFLYVIHISLACLFFPPRRSFVVPLLAVFLYGGLIFFEQSGVLAVRNLFASRPGFEAGRWAHALQGCAIMVLLLMVWYVVSRLSEVIREGEKELMAADAELRRTQAERDRFALETTHQLKSPLDSIRSSIALMREGYLGEIPEPLLNVYNRIDRRCTEMSALVMDVLRLSRLRNTRPEEGIHGVIDMGLLLESIVAEMGPSAERRHIHLNRKIQPCQVIGIEPELRMMLGNLLANAINYSHDGGSVTVQCYRADSIVHVTIADEGIGIPEDKLSAVFNEYYRTREALEHNPASSGIGLAIVTHVARRHQVRMHVESRLGVGTSFHLEFCRSPAQSAESGNRPAMQHSAQTGVTP